MASSLQCVTGIGGVVCVVSLCRTNLLGSATNPRLIANLPYTSPSLTVSGSRPCLHRVCAALCLVACEPARQTCLRLPDIPSPVLH